MTVPTATTIRGTSIALSVGSKLRAASPARAWVSSGDGDVSIFDLVTGHVIARRHIAGAHYCERHLAHLAWQADGALCVIDENLESDPRTLTQPPERVLWVVGATNDRLWVQLEENAAGFDLPTGARLVLDAPKHLFRGVHADAGVVLADAPDGALVAFDAAHGRERWRVHPFKERTDGPRALTSRGPELHVRVGTRRRVGEFMLFARIDARTGQPLGVQETPADAKPLELDAPIFEEGRCTITRRAENGAVHTQSFAFPKSDIPIVLSDDPRVVATADVEGERVLIVVPLPDPARGPTLDALELVPLGPDQAPGGELAEVTFAGTVSPIVIAEHPVHGRINLIRREGEPAPAKGAKLRLEGIEVRPGPVVSVSKWSLDAPAPPRRVVTIALPPLPRSAPTTAHASDEPPLIAHALHVRAAEAGVALPNDVVRFVALVDREPMLAESLAHLGVGFDDVDFDDPLERLDDVGTFFPIWGNGYGDGYCGLLTANGRATPVKVRLPGVSPTPLEHGLLGEIWRVLEDPDEMEATARVAAEILESNGFARTKR